MASAARTRTRKTAQAKAKDDTPTQEELEQAGSQETVLLMQHQIAYLHGRVGSLRVALNRANRKIAELTVPPTT